MKRVVILGGGSGGAVAAKRLGRWSKEGEFEVVLIDRSRWHEYRPSYLWVMTGKREPAQVRRELSILSERYGTQVVNDEVTAIDTKARRVETGSGGVDYDYLIVSLGAELRRSQQVAGLEAPWELDEALAARERLAGRASSVVSWPAESRTTSEPTITGPTGRSSRES